MPAPHPAHPTSRSRALQRYLGRSFLALGILTVLFVAYQWWGSDLVEHDRQSALRAELAGELSRRRAEVPTPRPVGPHSPPGPATAPPLPPAADGQPVGTIDIPSIGLDQVIVEGVDAADLSSGPGHYPATPLPGQAGNAGIAGHRTTHGHPFYDLQAVTDGDDIVVTTLQGVFVYVVVGTSIVDPQDTAVLHPTPGPTLTLTTCNPRYSAAQRLVVRADLERSALFAAPRASPGPGPSERPGRSARAVAPPGPGWSSALGWTGALGASAVATWLGGRRVRPRSAGYLAGAPLVLLALVGVFSRLDALVPPGL